MLRVTLLGNLGADPETRYSQKGTQIVALRVAVNQVRTGPDGERQENTHWFRVRLSGRQLEYVQRLSQGTRVMVIGRLDISQYQSRDGETKTSYDVWADEVQAMSARSFSADTEPLDAEEPALVGVSSLGSGSTAGPNGKKADAKSEDLEDLPF
jgi:single-strand DNA-binding protein